MDLDVDISEGTREETPLEFEPNAHPTVDDPRGNEPDGTLQWPMVNAQLANPHPILAAVNPQLALAAVVPHPFLPEPDVQPGQGLMGAPGHHPGLMGAPGHQPGPSGAPGHQPGSSGASGSRLSTPGTRGGVNDGLVVPDRVHYRQRPSAHSRIQDNRGQGEDDERGSSEDDDEEATGSGARRRFR